MTELFPGTKIHVVFYPYFLTPRFLPISSTSHYLPIILQFPLLTSTLQYCMRVTTVGKCQVGSALRPPNSLMAVYSSPDNPSRILMSADIKPPSARESGIHIDFPA